MKPEKVVFLLSKGESGSSRGFGLRASSLRLVDFLPTFWDGEFSPRFGDLFIFLELERFLVGL